MQSLTIEIDDDLAESLGKIGASQQMTEAQTAAYLLDRTLYGITRRLNITSEEYQPQSIIVMVDDSDDILKRYRCNTCGNIVFEYCGQTKVTMNGRYDRETMMIDAETVDPQKVGFGMPTVIECQGRVLVQFPNGRSGKVRCGNKYFKLRS